MCFGYADAVKNKPSGYSFLSELERLSARRISIEAVQPKLDLAALDALPGKTLMGACLISATRPPRPRKRSGAASTPRSGTSRQGGSWSPRIAG